MHQDTITVRQGICIMVLFIFGSSAVIGGSTEAGQDSWLCLTLAMACALPVVILYSRIVTLCNGEDFFSALQIIFGKIFGKVIILLMSLYALHLAALVLRNFSEFVQVTMMPETPQIPVMIIMLAVVMYLAFSGARVLGKWCVIVLPIIIFMVVITFSLAFGQLDFKNVFPVFNHSVGTIANGTLKSFTFPFAETVLILAISTSMKKGSNPYRVYILGLLFGGAFLIFLFFRNLLILGAPMMKIAEFPSYTALRIVNLGKIFSRMEGIIILDYLLAGISKIAVCVLAASKGIGKLFELKDYKKTLIPIFLIVLAVGYYQYSNIMQMFAFLDVYKYYALPFQILIPLIIWIGAEIKFRKKKPDAQENAPETEK